MSFAPGTFTIAIFSRLGLAREALVRTIVSPRKRTWRPGDGWKKLVLDP
jgi:hypothetical protein